MDQRKVSVLDIPLAVFTFNALIHQVQKEAKDSVKSQKQQHPCARTQKSIFWASVSMLSNKVMHIRAAVFKEP